MDYVQLFTGSVDLTRVIRVQHAHGAPADKVPDGLRGRVLVLVRCGVTGLQSRVYVLDTQGIGIPGHAPC